MTPTANPHAHAAPLSLCDFCSEPDPMWLYPAVTYTAYVISTDHGNAHVQSNDAWAACNTCSDLIQNERWLSLAERAARAILALEQMPPGQLIPLNRICLDMHRQFRTHRAGARKRIVRDDA